MNKAIVLLSVLLAVGCSKSKPKPDYSVPIRKLAAIQAAAESGTTLERMGELVADLKTEFMLHPLEDQETQATIERLLGRSMEMWITWQSNRLYFIEVHGYDPATGKYLEGLKMTMGTFATGAYCGRRLLELDQRDGSEKQERGNRL
ncbi:MAG: hypothetical protein ACTHLW_18205 [Verrucomicrobiota bacterium]